MIDVNGTDIIEGDFSEIDRDIKRQTDNRIISIKFFELFCEV